MGSYCCHFIYFNATSNQIKMIKKNEKLNKFSCEIKYLNKNHNQIRNSARNNHNNQ